MDRRKAIKNLGLSFGLVVATPTAISLLQSCKNDPKIDWSPEFFSDNHGIVVKKLVGLILPQSGDLPGANDVNVAQFIDRYASRVASKEDQENFNGGLDAIITSLGTSVAKATDEDYTNLLTKYLKATPDQMEAFQNNDGDKQTLEALMGLRGISIWGYRNSQKVGTEILAYDPVPGVYFGCVSLEETTGGKAWSL